MTIRCPECGYENRDMYRFCGMCGATLRREPVSAPPSAPEPVAVASEPAPVEAPSIAPAAATTPGPPSLHYLLEEEPPKSRGKLYLTLALLVIAAGVIAWHWESDQRTSTEPAATSTSSPAPQTSAPAATSSAPASAKSAETPTPKEPPKTAAPPLVVAQETVPGSKATEEADAKPQEQDATPPPASDDASADSSTTADASPPAAAPAPAPKPKPDPKIATLPAPVLKGDDKLVGDGEKYLYGNGVPEDCSLAQKNLKAAAAHSNARALTLMGAMYATGHCVDRDLPTAYRWFAKALHQDPSNARVQQDLEILWKQMTPGERQLATKSGG